MALRNQSICPQDGCNSLRIVGDGDSLQILEEVLSRRSHFETAVEMHQLPRGSKCNRQAGGMLSVCGFVWRRLVVVVASNGGRGFEWRRMVSKDGDKWHNMREEEREWSLERTWHPSLSFKSGSLLIRYPHGAVPDMVGRSRVPARMDVDVAAGKGAPRTNGTVRLAVCSAGLYLELNLKGVTDLVLTQISMLTAWDTAKIWLSGVHELFTSRKLSCPATPGRQQ